MEARVIPLSDLPGRQKPSHLDRDMQRICEQPPVIMVRLHNEVYSLDVWTVWSTVLEACIATALHYAGTSTVPVADTDWEAP